MTQTGEETKAAVTEDDMAYALWRVKCAVRTLRRVPVRDRASRTTMWPDIVRDFWDCYGYNDPTPPRLVPTAVQITEMDEVLGWLAWLGRHGEPGAVRILWAKAEDYSDRRVARMVGLSPHTVKARYYQALYALAARFAKK